MEPLVRANSYKRHRFPPEVIRHAVWLYFWFTLSFRDVQELLAQRGIEAIVQVHNADASLFIPVGYGAG